mmetsp:Transcript_26078/g.41285  ORF Transcript_26078/g.41285 Transcript_26078/m.41285 type:complete len:294 (-) Transcript_26078:35-916(-)
MLNDTQQERKSHDGGNSNALTHSASTHQTPPGWVFQSTWVSEVNDLFSGVDMVLSGRHSLVVLIESPVIVYAVVCVVSSRSVMDSFEGFALALCWTLCSALSAYIGQVIGEISGYYMHKTNDDLARPAKLTRSANQARESSDETKNKTTKCNTHPPTKSTPTQTPLPCTYIKHHQRTKRPLLSPKTPDNLATHVNHEIPDQSSTPPGDETKFRSGTSSKQTRSSERHVSFSLSPSRHIALVLGTMFGCTVNFMASTLKAGIFVRIWVGLWSMGICFFSIFAASLGRARAKLKF